jgi:DNA-binding transcriptional ArsR family regulator
MDADVDVSKVAALFSDPTRVVFVTALANADALSAGDLADRAKVSPQTASEHLAKLTAAGFVAFEPHGRHRYFKLASPAVAAALEALSVIAPRRPVRSLKDAQRGSAIRAARTCYDHLAGTLGVAVAESLQQRGAISDAGDGFTITPKGERELRALGIDVEALRRQRRQLVRPCLDWSERRYHLAGAVGAALASRCFELGWIERTGKTRALRITHGGRDALRRELHIRV